MRPGRVDLVIGTLSAGQGMRPASAASHRILGVAVDKVNFIQGDTDIVPVGGGSQSGRSMRLAGIVVGNCSQAIIAKGRRIAAVLLKPTHPTSCSTRDVPCDRHRPQHRPVRDCEGGRSRHRPARDLAGPLRKN